MKKDKISSLLRKIVKEKLSPTREDRELVTTIYQSFNDLLGINNCVQIGSYPRFTAIKPLHDLDILYIIGAWDSAGLVPDKLLEHLSHQFKKDYKNPTNYTIKIVVQTHSISFKYIDNKDVEVFAVDLVPALIDGKNEFNKNAFRVPEIIKIKRGRSREYFYDQKNINHDSISWIKTDPIGYIEVSKRINSENDDFRRSVKFVKGWKNECKEINEKFPLKSFHIEQLVTEYYIAQPSPDLFDSLFHFFTNLKEDIRIPRIKDRADHTKFVDEYLNNLSDEQKNLVHEAVDAILIGFENITEANIGKVLAQGYYKRSAISERFLFDEKIPTLINDEYNFKIDGLIDKYDGYRKYKASLRSVGCLVDTKNNVEFKIVESNSPHEHTKWKVKNDNSCPEPRGEISNNSTALTPERTAFVGKHFVECFAIKADECIAKDRVEVKVRK